MKNVIDFPGRAAKEKKSDKKGAVKTKVAKGKAAASQSAAPVIDMTEKRAEMIQQERRQVKRTILSDFIGSFALVPRKGLLKIILYDISENGVAFDIPFAAGHFSLGEEVAMRVYLNHQTYFPFVVKIQNVRGLEEEGNYRHGANFVKGTINDEALHHFVRFIETVSANLHTDEGDLQVSSVMR